MCAPQVSTEKICKAGKKCLISLPRLVKSDSSYDKHQNTLLCVHSHSPNTGSEVSWKKRPQAAGEYPEPYGKTLNILFAPRRSIEHSWQSHGRAVSTPRPLVFPHSAEDS